MPRLATICAHRKAASRPGNSRQGGFFICGNGPEWTVSLALGRRARGPVRYRGPPGAGLEDITSPGTGEPGDRASLQPGQVELGDALGVGQDVDLDDLAAADGGAEHRGR